MARRQTISREQIPYDMRRKIFEETGPICPHCGEPLEFRGNFTIEHVIPLHKGGTNDPENLIGLCKSCNKAKSDDVIQPRGYYKYLPKNRLARLEHLFDEYLTKTDWLAYNNLFRTDREQVVIQVSQLMPSRKYINIPMTVGIQKISAEEAFDWLQVYTGRLKTEHKAIMAASPDLLLSPYYKITNGNTVYMLCTAYSAPINYALENSDYSAKLHAIHVDMFTNPELTDKPNLTPRLLYACLCAVLTRIKDTLLRGYERESMVPCLIQYPASDTYGDRIFEYVSSVYENQFRQTTLCDTEENPEPIQGWFTWFYQGHNVKRIADVDPRLSGTPEQVIEALKDLQNPFRERIESSPQLKSAAPAKKQNPKKHGKNRVNYKQMHHPEWKRRRRKHQ